MQYYIQRHASGCVGNCFLWWRRGGNGYTCNIDDAELFDEQDTRFQQIIKDTSKYTAWEKTYICLHAQRHIDHQYVDHERSGIKTDSQSREEVA